MLPHHRDAVVVAVASESVVSSFAAFHLARVVCGGGCSRRGEPAIEFHRSRRIGELTKERAEKNKR